MLPTLSSKDSNVITKVEIENLNNFSKLPDEIIKSEQFAQILTAIVEGKYSWACVLLLHWAKYQPQNYIPYRTYRRLMSTNRHC